MIEQLQISSFEGLVNVLQLYSLIGWHLLWLQYLARTQGDEEAAQYIDQQKIEITQTVSSRKIKTVKDFVIAAAVPGGFMPSKNNLCSAKKHCGKVSDSTSSAKASSLLNKYTGQVKVCIYAGLMK